MQMVMGLLKWCFITALTQKNIFCTLIMLQMVPLKPVDWALSTWRDTVFRDVRSCWICNATTGVIDSELGIRRSLPFCHKNRLICVRAIWCACTQDSPKQFSTWTVILMQTS